MAAYKSNPIILKGSRDEVFAKLSNLGAYQTLLEQMPDDLRRKAGDVRFTDEAIIINAAPVGEMRLEVEKRQAPELIEFRASNSPAPLKLILNLADAGTDTTELTSSIDVDVPAIIRPMIGPKMQEAANQMAALVARLFNGEAAQ